MSFECFASLQGGKAPTGWQMVLTLVLLMFIVVIGHDYYIQRRQARYLKVQGAAPEVKPEVRGGAPVFSMNVVGGFKAPANLAYHPGHAWAAKESRQVVRVGLDDFAARVVGHIDQIDLPARGRWLRQGERGWTIGRGAHRFEMLSPIEGEVIDINTAVLGNPSLAHEDPYGAGWLVAVQAPAVDGNMKNLLHGRLAQRWMEESVGALHTRISPGSEAYLQDGGHAIGDMLSLVPEAEWEKFVEEMLLG
jgi:glycine cleavage system H lipoate-binding protein